VGVGGREQLGSHGADSGGNPMTVVARWFVLLTWGTLGIVTAIIAFTATAGLTGSIAGSAVVGVCFGAAVVAGRVWNTDTSASFADVPRSIQRLFAVGAPLLIGQLLFATAFIIDPSFTKWDASPWRPMRSPHSCASAYWVACDQIHTAPDIYAETLYSFPQADPKARRTPRPIGPLEIDPYEYPPSFLVLPRVITAVASDFWSFRRVWFALTLAVTVIGLIVVARRFDRALGTSSLWLTPFVLLPPAMIITTILGNVQLAIIAASMLAMVLFERGRHAAGGALLAYAIVSKLYPGLLVFYLLLRRDWRAVGWTAAISIAIVAVTMVDFGVGPYLTFVSHLPELLGGEAFAAFRNPNGIAINESIPGLAFKLQLFGVPNMGFTASKILGWIYTVIVLVLVVRLARRPVADGREPLVWLVIIILATMRSPFLPTYAPFPSLWLATLLAALTWGRSRLFTMSVVLWCVLTFTLGTGGAPPVVNAIWTFMHTIAAFVLVAMAMRVAAAPVPGPSTRRSVGAPAPA
jgi:alpha-1,2-mannosyltransferase